MKAMHLPVLSEKVVEMLQIKRDGIYLDGTLGDGGHAEQILPQIGPQGLLIALDQDKDAVSFAKKRLQPYRSRVKFFHENFKNVGRVLEKEGGKADGILLDLGVSTRQLDSQERGFSFSLNADLDMRMDRCNKTTAFDLINHSSPKELVRIFKDYGEERWSKRIAKAVVIGRAKKTIQTTFELVRIILSAVPSKSKKYKIHPATRVFQALRIAINKELEALETVLDDGIKYLKADGRFCIISYHSLEDRLVKNKFRNYEKGCICPTDIPYCVCGIKGVLKVLTKKPIVPSQEEVKNNPRARSAKLRVAKKLFTQ